MTKSKNEDPGGFCRWVIAWDYCDGEMSGIAQQADDNSWMFFRVIGWDHEQGQRLFAVVPLDTARIDKFRTVLGNLEPEREPFWLPGPQNREKNAETTEDLAAWNNLQRTALASRPWHLLEGKDLLGHVKTRRVTPSESEQVVAAAKSEKVLFLEPPLIDEFLRRFERHSTDRS